jgi:hypothetical protein
MVSYFPRSSHLGHAEFVDPARGERAKNVHDLSRTATTKMKTQQPTIPQDDDHRVLKFVPRNSTALQNTASEPAAEDLSRYEQAGDEPDDFRTRMIVNAAAFALVAILIGIGIWLAISIADLRKTQDCVLTGRRDCTTIPAPRV